jgi:hypothetical protein
VFLALGFTTKPQAVEGKMVLDPPEINTQSLLLLTRAFLEISIWAAKLSGPLNPGTQQQTASSLIRLKSPLSIIERIVGSDIIEESGLQASFWHNSAASLEKHHKLLGVTPETADYEIYRTYLSQLMCNPSKALWYTEALKELSVLRNSPLLDTRVKKEESNNKPAFSTVAEHFSVLGCELPKTGDTFFGYDIIKYPQEEVIVECFQAKKDYLTMNGGTESDMKKLKDALAFIAKLGKSELITAVLASIEPAKPEMPTFTLEEAYKHLQVAPETDDESVIVGVHFNVSASRAPSAHALPHSYYASS